VTLSALDWLLYRALMNPLLERLRAALAPLSIAVDRELASGGMGTVYLARDLTLVRPLALKVLDPGLANPVATERFRLEARILASFRHPGIVPVHTAGTADGLLYYTMDYLEGQTLAQRLRGDPLPTEEAVALASDVLAALEVAHSHGVIHRDVKPENIFLVAGRAVLVDFGIAKISARASDPISETGGQPRTPEYCPPEQSDGREITPRTDQYALGMVLFESLTRRHWSVDRWVRNDWRGVPLHVRPALRRALSHAPQDRWPDVTAFRRSLQRPWPSRVRRAARGSVSLSVAGLAVWLMVRGCRPEADLRFEPLDAQGPAAVRHLSDSLAISAAAQLSGFPDFTVIGPGGGKARYTVKGSVALLGPTLQVRMAVGDRAFTVRVPADQWPRADSVLVDSILVTLFRDNPLDIDLPVRVVPSAPEGVKAFLDAEKLFAQGRYLEAYEGYRRALDVDSTCWLCAWRFAEVERWLGLSTDTAMRRLSLAHLASFPDAYRQLISADTLPFAEQLEQLGSLSRRSPRFLFAAFNYGDELLHRGPLIGRGRRDAAGPFSEALALRRDFTPAREHLAWLWIAEGDSAAARGALDTLEHRARSTGPSTGLRELLSVAWAWRFLPTAQAAQATDRELANASARGVTELGAGARFLNGFDAPRGALWLGRRLEQAPEFARSALIAQAIAWVMLGQPDSALKEADRLSAEIPSADASLFHDELLALLILFPDSGSSDSAAALREALGALARSGHLRPEEEGRAEWLSELLAVRFGSPVPPAAAGAVPPPGARRLLQAVSEAREGRYRQALETSRPLTWLLAPALADLPCLRASLHLLRAEWWGHLGEPGRAADELRWYENSDMVSLPVSGAQPMEIDWALGVWARWRRAGLLGPDSRAERCALLGQVTRFWAGGAPAWAAKADSARTEERTEKCSTLP
jgi:hypothetical protein